MKTVKGNRKRFCAAELLLVEGIREETGRDKVLFSFQRSQITNSRIANTGSPTLFTPKKQISGYLPASGSIENCTNSDTFYLSHTSLYLSYTLYIRPFLVVMLQQQHVKNVTVGVGVSKLLLQSFMAKSMHKTS